MTSFYKKVLRIAVVFMPAAVLLAFVGCRVAQLYHPADSYAGPAVRINELCAKNLSGLTDDDGDHSDWVELYNASDAAVDLTGWALSDKKSEPNRWVFPALTLEPGEYYVLFASGKDQAVDGQLHTSFCLNSDGETLTLSDATGKTVDTLAFPVQKWDISYGRLGLEPERLGYFSTLTPGGANPGVFMTTETNRESAELGTVQFSSPGGFYDQSFALTLSCNAPDALILYTTDGSAPCIGSEIFTGPLTVEPPAETQWAAKPFSPMYHNWLYAFGTGEIAKCRVIRAAVYKDGSVSPAVTQTYFIAPETTLPVVSLVTDPDALFDEAYGLCVPGAIGSFSQESPYAALTAALTNSSLNDKIDANIEIYDENGQLQLNKTNRLSLAGGASRRLSPTKSFRIRLDEGSYTFCLNGTSYTLNTFDLRSPRTDEWKCALYKDSFADNLLLSEGLAAQPCTPVQLYLDGEYWGIYYLKESKQTSLLQSCAPLGEDDLETIKITEGLTVDNLAGADPDALLAEFTTLYAQLQEADLSTPEGYAWANERFDLDSFARYTAINIYLNNTDWLQRSNNIMLWRSIRTDSAIPQADGRWRFVLFDFDNILADPDADTIADLLSQPCEPDHPETCIRLLFQKLWENDRFRENFIAQIQDLSDGLFEPTALTTAWQEHIDTLRPEISQLMERIRIVKRTNLPAQLWHRYVMSYMGELQPYTPDAWEQDAAEVVDFIARRPAALRALLQMKN